MKLHQLRSFKEILSHGFSLTRAAEHLNASQPGLTRHVQLLEQELGTSLFERDGKRLTGLTTSGAALRPIAERILRDIDNLYRVAAEFAGGEVGSVVIAASPTQARYGVPRFVRPFRDLFPNVRFELREGRSAQTREWLAEGLADFSISSAPSEPVPGLLFFAYSELHWIALVRPEHPLLKRGPDVTLSDVADHPLITYNADYSSRAVLMRAFNRDGLTPDIVMSAPDADVMKKYVLSDLGVALVTHLAYDAGVDSGLLAIEIKHLIPSMTLSIGIRQPNDLSNAARAMINLIAPSVIGSMAIARNGGMPTTFR